MIKQFKIFAEGTTAPVRVDPTPVPKRTRGRPPKHPKSADLPLSDQLDAFFVDIKSKLEASTRQILGDALAPLHSLLQKQLDAISEHLSSLQQECRAEVAKLTSSVTLIQEELASRSTAAAAARTTSFPPASHSARGDGSSSVARSAPSQQGSISVARKFNVVLFGISECAHGTPRHERFNQDLSKIADVLTTIDSSFSSISVSDLRRLGQYSPDASSPRPLLVSFLRTSDVQYILGHSHEISSPYRVQPDRSHQERADRALLLHERFQLTSSGRVDRSSIKIKHLSMFVNDRLHCKVVDGQLVRSHTLGDLFLTEPGDTPVSHSQED